MATKQQEASYVGLITLPKKKEKDAVKKGILICGITRIFLLKTDNGKVRHFIHFNVSLLFFQIISEGHLIELTEVTSIAKDASLSPKEIKIVFKNGCIIEGASEQADELINCIKSAYIYSFSSFPPERRFKLNVQPESRHDKTNK